MKCFGHLKAPLPTTKAFIAWPWWTAPSSYVMQSWHQIAPCFEWGWMKVVSLTHETLFRNTLHLPKYHFLYKLQNLWHFLTSTASIKVQRKKESTWRYKNNYIGIVLKLILSRESQRNHSQVRLWLRHEMHWDFGNTHRYLFIHRVKWNHLEFDGDDRCVIFWLVH